MVGGAIDMRGNDVVILAFTLKTKDRLEKH